MNLVQSQIIFQSRNGEEKSKKERAEKEETLIEYRERIFGRIRKESGKNLDRVPNKLKKKKKKKKRMEKGRILNDPEVSNGAVPAMRGEAVVGW